MIGGKAAELGESCRAGLPARIAEAVRLAIAGLRPARAWTGMGRESGLSFNPRFLMRDGSVLMNPPKGSSDFIRPMAGIDPDVTAVYFESVDKEPLATYVNFPMHCAIAGGSQFSADYPHVLARLLGGVKGPQMLTVFTMGTAGDVNHLDVHDIHQLTGQAEVERAGTILAREVIKTYARLEPLDPAAIRFRTERLQLQAREVRPGDLEKAREIFPRYGRPLALQFDDIEWFTNEVNVRHAISKPRRKDGGQKWEWHVGPPISRKSLRRIAATESVMKMLAELKVGKPGTAFLFPGNCSGFIDPDTFDAEIWKPIAEKAGMPGTRFHGATSSRPS